jgi:hypothetical protein
MTDDAGSDGTATDAGGVDQRLAPADAFGLLGDASRLEIVTALHDAVEEAPVAFSTLYDRVDVDGTSRFDYHLDELVPHFVARSDDGYELTTAGRRVARAVAAGTYTDAPRLGPVDIDGDCYACGDAALSAAYGGERFRVDCASCGADVLAIRVPPSVVRGRDSADAVDAVERWSRTQVEQATRGLCPTCGGAVEPSVVADLGPTVDPEVAAAYDCTVCGRQVMTGFAALASRHQEVAAFLAERGRAPGEDRYWERPAWITGEHLDVVSRDPWRVEVCVPAEDDVCVVTFDGDLAVVDASVEAGDGGGGDGGEGDGGGGDGGGGDGGEGDGGEGDGAES